ncbi:EHBP1 family protein [Megaselia abdita]
MGSVWKRLQRVNKRAAKFQFTASFHELHVETTAKWRPTNLSVVWTRRSRRVVSAPLPWEPDMMNPLDGHVVWPVPDNHSISVTLFKDPRTHEMEDKDWTFVLEDVTNLGKKRVLASASINMRKYASIEPTQQSFTLSLKPTSKKIVTADLELTISCVFLREGKATDEDMQSVVSLMSVNNNCDVAPLDDLEDLPDMDNPDISEHMMDFTQQLEQMTSSLNGCLDLSTPISVPSLSDDPTPLVENNRIVYETVQVEIENKKKFEEEDDISEKTPSAPIISPIAASTPIKFKPSVVSEETKDDKKLDVGRLRYQKVELNKLPPPKWAVETKKEELKENKTDSNVTIEIKINDESTSTIKQDSQVLDTTKSVSESNKDNSKRSELQPLELKKNYNNEVNEKTEKIVLRDRTPGPDLLEWCKEVTADCKLVKVTNLTTSWRNGMAFCAIIHHFKPDLIDMSKLAPNEVEKNCKLAFDTAENLGIPKVIDPKDMSLLAVPDKLAVMTYLHQMRAHFTGKQLQIEQYGETCEESSYVIGDYKSDMDHQNILNLSHMKTAIQSKRNSIDDDRITSPQSPNSIKDMRNLFSPSSKNLVNKLLLSPAKEKITSPLNNNSLDKEPQRNNNSNNINLNNGSLMSRRELVDPFGSDDEGDDNTKKPSESSSPPASPSIENSAAQKILSRHKEMSEKAKAMREKLRIFNGDNKSDNDNERQQKLQQMARQLIAETKQKSTDNSPSKKYESPQISPIKKLGYTISDFDNFSKISPSHRMFEKNGNTSPLKAFNVGDKISPKIEKRGLGDKSSYIENELESLEREQEAIDEKASDLEKKLRAVMGGNSKTEETEEQLLAQWFTLVNKKNALLRRQMQLNILEQESDLERRYDLLNQELRAAQSVEDWRKSEVQREREKLLLEELMSIVDKRDELVQHLHNQEIAIEDDDEIAKKVEHVDISDLSRKENCVIS